MRYVKFFLTAVLLFCCFHSFAYDFEVDGLCYNILSENQVEVTYKAYYGQGDYSGKLVIPEKVKYGGKEYVVSVIGDNAFSRCSGLTGSLVIPNSVTHIGYCAFFCCSGFTGSLTIPKSVTSIAGQAFDGCSSLTGSLTIPNSVTTIGHRTFKGCKFTGSLIIPNSVTRIEESVFDGCSGFTGSLIIPSSVTSIDNYAFNGCSGFTGSLTIPSSVTSIGDDAFYGCSGLTSLFLPSSVTSIGYKAFMYCKRLSYVESQMETPFSFGQDIFMSIASNAILVIPKGESYPYGITKWFAETRRVSASYILSISSSGNGYASYDGTSIRNKTEEFSLTEGESPMITFTPDNGYRIKSVKVNNSTVSISNNQYTVNNINANTMVSVEFEAIPVTTYTLSITVSGNGSATYDGTSIRDNARSFTVEEGANATITLSPDNGYKVNLGEVTGYHSYNLNNNKLTFSNIKNDLSVEIKFIAIPTYKLSIAASGNGSASYDGTTIRDKATSFTVDEGISAKITFSPDDGYRIKSVKVNNSTVSVSNNQYTVSNIKANTTVSVEFEAIPVTTYTLSITASGNGSASYDGTTIRGKTSSFTVNEGTLATIKFTPDDGCQIKDVKVNGLVVSISNGQYTISSMNRNTTVEVEFVEILSQFESGSINYRVVSEADKTVRVAAGSYGQVLEVPATVNYQNENWTVTGIDDGALSECKALAAIIWNPDAAFTEKVSNPNLLLYVTKSEYAPSSIKNVVVDGSAYIITLTDVASGNDFYCPQAFTAQQISYTHNYRMSTGIGEARGWETIVLPFDVQKVTHESKGEIVPFANWKSGDSKRPFWLMERNSSGWAQAESIKANTPYIISMPNNPEYKSGFLLNGNVTFSAENVIVPTSDNLHSVRYNGQTFMPNYRNQRDDNYYALNVNNDYVTYSGSDVEGSKFLIGLRAVRPFEAYMTSVPQARSYIAIDEDMPTGIGDITEILADERTVRVYNLNGQLILAEENKRIDEIKSLLSAGVYIVNGKKIIIR